MDDSTADLKPVNHKRTPSFELVIQKMISNGKNPRDYNITRKGPRQYEICKKISNPVTVEYVERDSESSPKPRERKSIKQQHNSLRSSRMIKGKSSVRVSSEDIESSEEEGQHIENRKRPKRNVETRKTKGSVDISEALLSKRRHRTSLVGSSKHDRRKGVTSRRTRRNKNVFKKKPTDRNPRKPKSILKKRGQYDSLEEEEEEHYDEIEDEQESTESEEIVSDRIHQNSDPSDVLIPSDSVEQERRIQRRKGRGRSRAISPVRRNRRRSRSRGPKISYSDSVSRANSDEMSEDESMNPSVRSTQRKGKHPVRKKSQRRRDKDQEVLDKNINRMEVLLQGVKTPEKTHVNDFDRSWITQGHGPKVGTWEGLDDIYQFVDSVYPKGGKPKKKNVSKQHSAESTSSSEGVQRFTSIKKVASSVQNNAKTNHEDVKQLLSEGGKDSKLPKLKGFQTILSEETSESSGMHAVPRSIQVANRTERIRKGAPSSSFSKRSSVAPFAYTTIYNHMTEYPDLVDTSLIIPQNSKRYKAKIEKAISAIDMIVEEYQQEYKQKNVKGDLVDMPPPDCLRKVICFHNLAKNHTIEPPAGFGLVMNTTKNVPIKTTPFNPTKFYYGVLLFRIPIDERIDNPESISKFSIKYRDDETEEEREISLLDYIEETPPYYLAESLIPKESKDYRGSMEDSEEENLDYPILDTPMMNEFLDGRGTYAGLYRSCTREDDWNKQIWVGVQCNDPKASQELYDHLRQVQDEGMGITEKDRGFSPIVKSDLNREDQHKEKSEETEGSDSDEREDNLGHEDKSEEDKEAISENNRPKIMANWASAIFNNPKVREAKQRMKDARLKVAQEVLAAYGVNVTTEDIKKHCYPFIETISNSFYHDVSTSSYMFAGSGVTIISPDTKEVVVGERPNRGPIILHGPPKSFETRTSVRDDTLSWNLTEAKGLYRLFPCSTGRQRTNTEVKDYLKTSSTASKKVPILEHIVYSGKFEKEVKYYPSSFTEGNKNTKGRTFIDPTEGNFHARLTNITYNKRTISHIKREEKCGFNRDWRVTELEPIAIRVGVEREKVNLFSF